MLHLPCLQTVDFKAEKNLGGSIYFAFSPPLWQQLWLNQSLQAGKWPGSSSSAVEEGATQCVRGWESLSPAYRWLFRLHCHMNASCVICWMHYKCWQTDEISICIMTCWLKQRVESWFKSATHNELDADYNIVCLGVYMVLTRVLLDYGWVSFRYTFHWVESWRFIGV